MHAHWLVLLKRKCRQFPLDKNCSTSLSLSLSLFHSIVDYFIQCITYQQIDYGYIFLGLLPSLTPRMFISYIDICISERADVRVWVCGCVCVGSLIHVRILCTKFIDQTHSSNWLNVTYWNFNEPITNSNLYRNFICIPLLDVVIPGVHTIQAVKLLSRLSHIWRHWFHLRNEILCLSIHHLKRYAYIMCSTVHNTLLCVCSFHGIHFELSWLSSVRTINYKFSTVFCMWNYNWSEATDKSTKPLHTFNLPTITTTRSSFPFSFIHRQYGNNCVLNTLFCNYKL